MKKLTLILLLIPLISFSQNDEKIYGEFYLFQPKKEVKKLFKKSKDKYQSIFFGGQKFWMINKPLISSFIYDEGKLTQIRLFATQVGSSDELQSQIIKNLDKYFIENGFTELFRQTHWDTPVFFDNKQMGVVYENPKGNTVINLSMRTEGVLYNPGIFTNNHTYIDIIPATLFEKNIQMNKKKEQLDNSDF